SRQRGSGDPVRSRKLWCAAGPESRMIAIAAWPSPLAGANIVSVVAPCVTGSGIHRVEELGIRLRLLQLAQQELDRIRRAHRVQNSPEDKHLGQIVLRDQELFLASAGFQDIHGRET